MTAKVEIDTNASPVSLFKLLADETRWRVVQELRLSDRSVRDLVHLVQAPQSLVSYHLQALRDASLVTAHKSDSDGRTVYYGLNVGSVMQVQQRFAETLRLPVSGVPVASHATILFLCSHNSARSQMAEGWLRAIGPTTLKVRSAGIMTNGVHPLAVEVMAERGIDIGHQFAKGLTSFDGIKPDVLVTVCDLAKEACDSDLPVGQTIHWSIPDPSSATGSVDDQRAVFRAVRDDIEQRVTGLLGLLARS